MAVVPEALGPDRQHEPSPRRSRWDYPTTSLVAGFKDLLLRASEFLVHRSAPFRYGFALAAFGLAMIGRILCDPILGEMHIFPTFFVALIFTTWFAGTGPAIMNLFLGLAGALLFFVHPRFSFVLPPREHQVGAILYAFVGISHIVTNHLFRSAKGQLEQRTFDLTVTNTKLEREIAERRKVEAEVQRLATIVSSSTDSIVGFSLDGTITDWNVGSERLYGYPRMAMLGKPVSSLFPADRAAEPARILERIRAGESVEPFETSRRRQDGKLIVASVSVSPIRDAEGFITGAAEIARDLTATKRLEEQLLKAQKMEAIGRLAGGVAHDFNNILMIITGLSDMIVNDTQRDHVAHHHGMEIKEAADRAINLTKQLLAFSRKQIIAPTILNLNTLILDMETMLHRLMGESVELSLDLSARALIKADRGQIEQVLVNLVMNARDAMPLGGKLRLATRDVSTADAGIPQSPDLASPLLVKLTVSDTGCGMSEEVQAHLFEPFFTTKEEEKGTGLGLATVYGIVQQNGGVIQAFSESGRGTTFEVYLPGHLGSQEETPPPVSYKVTGGKETILLVEDEHVLRRLARRMLQNLGYHVLEASGGPEAVEIAERHAAPIDLLITDVVMPRMSGRKLADQLRAKRAGLRTLFLSGYTDDTVVRHGVLEENMNFLSKPCSLDALASKVREVLDGKGRE